MSVESLTSQQPLVLILMGTFNGEKYIREQLDSIASQTHPNWKMVISDDGSTDRTLEIAKAWADAIGVDRVEFRSGPQKGFAQNFLSMACDSNLHADFYAFCDQDDVWKKNKLEAALNFLVCRGSKDEPLLYCGRTEYVNHRLETLGYSRVFSKPLCFKNALVQCVAGGNTMVFNQPLKRVLEIIGTVPSSSHDWWLYQVACGVGGPVFFDRRSLILYRQHASCISGENSSLRASFKRIRMALAGDFKKSVDAMIRCLVKCETIFNDDSNKVLSNFTACRGGDFLSRTLGLYRLGIFRQDPFSNAALYFLASLKKL